MLFDQDDGFIRVPRLKRMMAKIFDHRGGCHADERFVLDDQDDNVVGGLSHYVTPLPEKVGSKVRLPHSSADNDNMSLVSRD